MDLTNRSVFDAVSPFRNGEEQKLSQLFLSDLYKREELQENLPTRFYTDKAHWPTDYRTEQLLQLNSSAKLFIVHGQGPIESFVEMHHADTIHTHPPNSNESTIEGLSPCTATVEHVKNLSLNNFLLYFGLITLWRVGQNWTLVAFQQHP